MDVAGGMYWIVAREQQRIEQYREPRMKIPPSGIQIENIRRADDRDATGFYDAMELAREGELVLEMLDDLEAARNIDGVVIVRKPPVVSDRRALHGLVAKEIRKKVRRRDHIRWSDAHFALGVLSSEL
jgi:hypothetical protein